MPSRPFHRASLRLALLLVLSACGSRPRPAPVVLVGIDGLDPGVTAELLAAGRLPHLASIAERGVLGRIRSMVPSYSPVIWTSIATGQEQAAHGIVDFAEPPAAGEELGRPFTSNCRKVPALWNIVSDAGLTVDCVGWWVTWPAEAVNGRLVASYAAQAQAHVLWKPSLWQALSEQTHPPALTREIEPLVVFAEEVEELRPQLARAFRVPAETSALGDRLISDLAWTLAGDLSFAAIGEHFLANAPADVVLIYLALPDVAGHRFWRYYRPTDFAYDVPEPDKSGLAGMLADAYAETDRLLGELLARVPADATVIVVSDHGMGPDSEARHDPEALTSGHHREAQPGIFAAMGPRVQHLGNLLGDERRGDLGHVLGVAPLVLRVLELPIPEHWPAAPSNPLESVLDERWRRDHRRELGPNRDASFRPATPARLPAEDVDQSFRRFFSDLGYMGEESE